jgi:hypothetical protein
MARFTRVPVLVAAMALGAVVAGGAPAGAIGLTSFSMAPASGPAGTVVSVSGGGCAPGLLLSSSLDRVVVTMATVPPTTAQIPVSSGGAWSGSITVPAGAAAAPALVTPVCFSDGLQSLLTIYTPKTFTVTAAAAPTTTTPNDPPPTTLPEQTQQPPVTQPPGGHGNNPTSTTKPGATHTTPPGGGGPIAGVPGGGSSSPGAADPGSTDGGSTDGGSGAAPGGKPAAAGHSRAETVSVAANLQAPDLGGADAPGDGSGLGWIGWLALVLLLGGAVAGGLLFRRYRDSEAEIPRPG